MTNSEGYKLQKYDKVIVTGWSPLTNTTRLAETVEKKDNKLEARVLEISKRTDEAKIIYRKNGNPLSKWHAMYASMSRFENPGIGMEWVKFFNLKYPENDNPKDPNEYDDSDILEE